MGGIGGRCVVEIADPSLSVPALGDSVQVSLGKGDGTTPVFTGEVRQVTRTATALRITATDGLAKLATFDLEMAYENMQREAAWAIKGQRRPKSEPVQVQKEKK